MMTLENYRQAAMLAERSRVAGIMAALGPHLDARTAGRIALQDTTLTPELATVRAAEAVRTGRSVAEAFGLRTN
jgi:hypothetical protein